MKAILQDSSEFDGDDIGAELPSTRRGLRCNINLSGAGLFVWRDDVSCLELMMVWSWIRSSDQCLVEDKLLTDCATTLDSPLTDIPLLSRRPRPFSLEPIVLPPIPLGLVCLVPQRRAGHLILRYDAREEYLLDF